MCAVTTTGDNALQIRPTLLASSLAPALPNAGNLGGGGFMGVYGANNAKSVALDRREAAPHPFTRGRYLDAQGPVIDGKPLCTPYAAGVPGTVAGMAHALKTWSTLTCGANAAPALRRSQTCRL